MGKEDCFYPGGYLCAGPMIRSGFSLFLASFLLFSFSLPSLPSFVLRAFAHSFIHSFLPSFFLSLSLYLSLHQFYLQVLKPLLIVLFIEFCQIHIPVQLPQSRKKTFHQYKMSPSFPLQSAPTFPAPASTDLIVIID